MAPVIVFKKSVLELFRIVISWTLRSRSVAGEQTSRGGDSPVRTRRSRLRRWAGRGNRFIWLQFSLGRAGIMGPARRSLNSRVSILVALPLIRLKPARVSQTLTLRITVSCITLFIGLFPRIAPRGLKTRGRRVKTRPTGAFRRCRVRVLLTIVRAGAR